MNMLPINAESKRRIKWADQQRKQQKQASKPFGRQAVVKTLAEVDDKINPSRED